MLLSLSLSLLLLSCVGIRETRRGLISEPQEKDKGSLSLSLRGWGKGIEDRKLTLYYQSAVRAVCVKIYKLPLELKRNSSGSGGS